jgi:hypothetical protein
LLTGIPILVAKNTYLGALVEEMGIGRSVECGDTGALEQALHDALEGRGWYAEALAALRDVDVSERIEQNMTAMADGVLG